MIRIHRPGVAEILSEAEASALREVAGTLAERLADVGAGARLVWATADAERSPSVFSISPSRIVTLRAAFFVPTRVRLGLEAWSDTHEWVVDVGGQSVAVVAHEVEKVVRMATRQAWYPLALSSGAQCYEPEGPFAQLPAQLPALISRGGPRTILDRARGLAAVGYGGEATRMALAAIRLASSQRLCLHAPGQFADADDKTDPGRVIELAQAAVDDTELPERPPGYAAVSAWLVDARLEESTSA